MTWESYDVNRITCFVVSPGRLIQQVLQTFNGRHLVSQSLERNHLTAAKSNGEIALGLFTMLASSKLIANSLRERTSPTIVPAGDFLLFGRALKVLIIFRILSVSAY